MVERRVSRAVGLVQVSVVFNEESGNRCVAISACHKKRGPLVFISFINVNSGDMFNKILDRFKVAISRRINKWSVFVPAAKLAKLSPVLQQ